MAIKKKKKYVKPTMEIIKYDRELPLLTGSDIGGSDDDDDNPYWHKPDTPPGCQSAWWCGN